jgi:hypothetical protein
MKFKRKVASLLTAVMAFSGLATFNVSADVMPLSIDMLSDPAVTAANTARVHAANDELVEARVLLDQLLTGFLANEQPTVVPVPGIASVQRATSMAGVASALSALEAILPVAVIAAPDVAGQVSAVIANLRLVYTPAVATPTALPASGLLYAGANAATPAARTAAFNQARNIILGAGYDLGRLADANIANLLLISEIENAFDELFFLVDDGGALASAFVEADSVTVTPANRTLAAGNAAAAMVHVLDALAELGTVVPDPTLTVVQTLVDLAIAELDGTGTTLTAANVNAVLAIVGPNIPAAGVITAAMFNTARDATLTARAAIVAAITLLELARDASPDLPPGPRFVVNPGQQLAGVQSTNIAEVAPDNVIRITLTDFENAPTPSQINAVAVGAPAFTLTSSAVTVVSTAGNEMVIDVAFSGMLPAVFANRLMNVTMPGIPGAAPLTVAQGQFNVNVQQFVDTTRSIIRPHVATIFSPLSTFNQMHRLVDPAAGLNAGVVSALPAPNNVINAPELVIPIRELPRNAAEIRVTVSGVGLAPWSTGFNSAEVADGLPVSALTNAEITSLARATSTASHVLPAAGTEGFMRSPISETMWYYTGKQGALTTVAGVYGTPSRANEIPYILILDGTVMRIIFPATHDMPDDSVLRVPLLIGSGTAAERDALRNITVAGMVTPYGQEAPVRTMPIVVGGAGVTFSIDGAVATGRNFVQLPRLVLSEPLGAAGALEPGGHIILELPLGFRWDPSSEITFTRLFPNATVFLPAADAHGSARDGWGAQSIMVIHLSGPVNRIVPGASDRLEINGLIVRPADTVGNTLTEGPVYVTVRTLTGAAAENVNSQLLNPANAMWQAGTQNWMVIGTPNRFMGSAPVNVNRAFISATPNNLLVGRFSDFDVIFERTHGTAALNNAGTISTIVGGWLPAPQNQQSRTQFERIADRPLLTGAAGNVATVSFREVVPNSAWAAHNLTFTLLDEHGNIHPYASIHSVNFTPSVNGAPTPGITGAARLNQVMPSRVSGVFENRVGGARGETLAGSDVQFDPNGRSVNVSGMRLNHIYANQGMIQLNAAFWITADVNFEGAVYVAVTDMGRAFTGGFGVIDVAPLHIANVRRGIDVETRNTTVQVGFQQWDVADIIIREMQPGDFRPGQRIEISLGEYMMGNVAGSSNVQFVPISTMAVDRHMTIGGASNAQNRVIARFQPFHQAATSLVIDVTQGTRGDVPSYLHLHGLQVRVIRDVPFGTYELVVRGTSVLNNENFINGNLDNQDRPLRPTDNNFRRYMHRSFMIENYITVATPGAGGTTDLHGETVIFWQDGSTHVVIDGVHMPLLDESGNPVAIRNIGGRTFVPIRAISSLLGGTVGWVPDARGPGQHEVEVYLAGRRVSFWRDYSYHQIWGGPSRPNVPGERVNVVLVDGTHMVPIRGLINAFDLETVDNFTAGTTTINPR